MNIYTPKSLNKGYKRYAVMVFFYGEVWLAGSGSSRRYSPDYLMDHNIVLVTINFRLGPLGFLSTADDVVSGNQAMKDQVQALRWIRENIIAFGGDPNKVTIVGHSTGAIGVSLIMLSPIAKASGTSIVPLSFNTPAMARASAERLGRELNCSTATSQALLTCLRTKNAKVIAAQPFKWTIAGGISLDPFLPVVESNKRGAFLTEEPSVLVKTGRYADVPWLNGLTVSEGALATVAYYRQQNRTKLKQLNDNFFKLIPSLLEYKVGCSKTSQNLISRRIRQHYFGHKALDESTRMKIVAMFSDDWFKFGSATTVKAYLHTKRSPVYFYQLAYKGSLSFTNFLRDTVRDYGVSHGDDLLYLFPVNGLSNGNNEITARDSRMVDIMTTLYTNFVITGKPVPRATRMLPVIWQRVKTNDLESFVIGGPGNFTIAKNIYKETLDFWSKLPCRAGLSRSSKLADMQD